jgi:hypothetical protein
MNSGVKLEDAISLEIQATSSDYMRAYRRRFWRSLGWVVFPGAALALLPIERASAFRAELSAGAPSAIAVATAAYTGVALFLAFMVELLARCFTRYALRKSPAALAPTLLTFTPEGLHAQGSHVAWHEFSSAVETTSAFQLQLRTGPYVLIPRRQVSSVLQIRRVLQTYLGKRARVRT